MAPDVLEGLSAAQVEAVTTPAGPLAIVAGPGAGKTRTLTRRVAYQESDPARTLVLTFSRRAARELDLRLRRLGVSGATTGTFHAVAWAEITRSRMETGLPVVSVLGRPARLIAAAVREALGRDPWPGEPGSIAGEWSRLRASCITPHGPVWDAYARAKRSRRVVDLDDLIADATELVSDSTRWRFRHVYVDEYQDVNGAHLDFLRALVGGRPEVCVVGDPAQAIYGFNGSVPDIFDRLAVDWPGITTVRLGDNFRSSPEIVTVAGTLFASGRSSAPPGPIPSVTAFADPSAEDAAVVAAVAARRVPGRSWGGAAILARTNERLRRIGELLDGCAVPWHMRDPRPLSDDPALASAGPDDPAAALDVSGPLADALAEYRRTSPLGTVRMFASWLDATGVTSDRGEPGGVELTTFHRAKGLEWRSVWVVGVAGLDHTAEERRLLYVALTRATEDLAVSWSGAPTDVTDALVGAHARLARRPARPENQRRLRSLVASLT